MHTVIKASTPEECRQEIVDYLEAEMIAVEQKPDYPTKTRDIALINKLRLVIKSTNIIPSN